MRNYWLLVLALVLLALACFPSDDVCGETIDYSSLVEEASSGDTVFIDGDWSISEDIEVPAGVTVVLRCFDGDQGYVDGRNPDGTKPADKHLYLTVAVEKDATLTVRGTLLVNAVTCWPEWSCDLNITGGYAEVLNKGHIIVEDGGLYDNFGETSGSGDLLVKEGGELRDRYTISHWRGGTAARACMNNGIYPINEYSMRSVTCGIMIEHGGSYTGTVKLYVGGAMRFGLFPQIGEGGIIRPDPGSLVEKTRSNGRTVYTITGGAEFSGSDLSIQGHRASTRDYVFPLDGDTDLVLTNGTYRVSSDFKVLPGSRITLSGSVLEIADGCSLSLYDYFTDRTSWTGTEYPSERSPSYLYLSGGSSLLCSGTFGGRVFVDASSTVSVPDGSAGTTTREVMGEDGYWEVLHHAVTMHGAPGRWIGWYCTDPGLEEQISDEDLAGWTSMLYSAASETPVAEDRLRSASEGSAVEHADDVYTPWMIAAIFAAVAALVVLVMHRRFKR